MDFLQSVVAEVKKLARNKNTCAEELAETEVKGEKQSGSRCQQRWARYDTGDKIARVNLELDDSETYCLCPSPRAAVSASCRCRRVVAVP